MKREIKFRAWDGKTYYYSDDNYLKWFPLRSFYEQNDFIWQQFTGLKDKNGVDIYEGDIVKGFYKYERIYQHKEVIWDYTKWALKPHIGISLVPSFLEVIGNIHENPELLK